eukprot:3375184-Prymnesium_polylepis.1
MPPSCAVGDGSAGSAACVVGGPAPGGRKELAIGLSGGARAPCTATGATRCSDAPPPPGAHACCGCGCCCCCCCCGGGCCCCCCC